MLQVKLLDDKEVLEVKIFPNFNLKNLKKAIAEISEKKILKGGRSLEIDFKIEELTVLDMIKVPEIAADKLHIDRYKAIIELQQIILGIFLQVNLASAYLTHEYCHLYSKVAIGINGKSSVVTQHGG